MDQINGFLIIFFGIFAFTALVFEPLYYFGCDWNGTTCALAASSEVISHVRSVWLIYTKWDPMFLVVPMWLRVMCTIEVFVFGPLYLIVIYGILYQSSWLPSVGFPFAGALIYSTIVYFAMEVIENLPGTDMKMVFEVNLPWTIVPMVLIYKLRVEDLQRRRIAMSKVGKKDT